MKTKKKTNNARQTTNQPRRSYSAEYIQQALALAERQGMTAAARTLGIAQSMLYRWRNEAQAAASVTDGEKSDQAEMHRLRKQVSALSEELEFLKKAAAYFAKLPK
jgi:transposase